MNEALIADPVRSKQILERIPAGRWGTAEDFEGAIVFLASKASDYVSGECLVVDGGWMGSKQSLSILRYILMIQDKLVLCTVLGPVSYALILIYILLLGIPKDMGQTRRVPELHHSFNPVTLRDRHSIYYIYCILHLLYTGQQESSHNVPSLYISSVPSISLIPTSTYLITSLHSLSYIHIIINHG
jgi:hypothetical protein